MLRRALIGFLLAGALFSALGGDVVHAAAGGGDYCCADDQNVSGWFSTELALLHAEWGWPKADPRELPACAVLGGARIAADGRVDTSTQGGFETAFDPCRRGHGSYDARPDIRDPSYYVQVRFLCNGRYPCGAAQFVLSRATRVTLTGLPPPIRCRVPRVIGLRLEIAKTRIRRAHCRVGRVRRVRSRRAGRVLAQKPGPGASHSRNYPVDLVVGRR